MYECDFAQHNISARPLSSRVRPTIPIHATAVFALDSDSCVLCSPRNIAIRKAKHKQKNRAHPPQARVHRARYAIVAHALGGVRCTTATITTTSSNTRERACVCVYVCV